MKVEIRALDSRADRGVFACGVAVLDEWLRRQAGQAQRRRLASVWVASPPDDPARVLGYYSLAPWQISFRDCPESLRKRLPEHPIPVCLLARLAIDCNSQGKGLGGVLLADALLRAYRASELVPVHAVVVHAKDERAASFYAKHGFSAFPREPRHLHLPMRSLQMLFADPASALGG